MPDKQDITFPLTVTEQEWDRELGGWRCPVLRIPGARVEGVFVTGRRADPASYEVVEGINVVHWTGPERPERVTVLIRLTEELSTKELTLRWKKLAIVVPIITVVVAWAVSLIPPRVRQPAEGAGLLPPMSACDRNVRISVPVDGQRVPVREEVKGTYQDLPKGHKVWTMVYPTNIGRFYPQNEARLTENTWSSEVIVGLDHEAGRTFLIYVALADEQAQNVLKMYAERAITSNESPGIPDLPAGVRLCQFITVTRK